MGERHLTIDARVAATRERSYICPSMKIDFESRARALRGVSDTGRGMQRDRGGVGVVKTLVSRPGIRVSRHNAGALIDRARDQPAPKATRLFFNVRELKKLINDVMRPARLPGQETRRGGGTMRIDLRSESSQNRAYLLTERPLLVLCVFQMTAARLENIVRCSSVVATLFFLSFVKIVTVTQMLLISIGLLYRLLRSFPHVCKIPLH